MAPSPASASPQLLSLVNQERAAAGVAPLARAADLDQVAQRWSERMAAENRLRHNPSLSSEVGGWRRIAENVGVGGSEAQVHGALMASAGHRANILDSRHSQVGIGVATGHGRVWVTQVFRQPVDGAAPAPVAQAPVGAVDVARATAPGRAEVRVAGWALDPDGGTTSVHVYVDGGWGTALAADRSRPDVAWSYPGHGDRLGFDGTVAVGHGTHRVCVFAINTGPSAPNPLLGCRQVTVSANPFGTLDRVAASATDDRVAVSGWTIDPSSTAPTTVHVYVDGRWGTQLAADRSRPDVAAAYPGHGDRRGFAGELRLPDGTHQVCAFGINVGAGDANTLLGCRRVSVNRSPLGSFDSASAQSGGVRVTGWAGDPDSAAPTSVHAYVGGRWGGAYPADVLRPDVRRVHPGLGERTGFSAVVPARAGEQVCVYAINVGPGSTNPLLGCRTAAPSS
ncbi:hypothetical protein GCM10027194_19460 [Thalassiella azotivora]